LSNLTGYFPGDFVYFGNNVHVYKSHLESVKEQINREPYSFPKLKIKKHLSSVYDIESLCFEDFELTDYCFHPPIKYIMAV
jgi:thymidylate synthase